jgi:hypothetical protein
MSLTGFLADGQAVVHNGLKLCPDEFFAGCVLRTN